MIKRERQKEEIGERTKKSIGEFILFNNLVLYGKQ